MLGFALKTSALGLRYMPSSRWTLPEPFRATVLSTFGAEVDGS